MRLVRLIQNRKSLRLRASMRMIWTVIVVAATTVVLGQEMDQARAELKDAHGKKVGQATLTESPRGVLMHVTLTNAPSGGHGFHIHETGKCEPPFTSAGNHFNPTGKMHGFENPKGPHAGDLPNVHVPAGGRLTFDVFAPDVTLKSGPNSLLDADGSALVVHQGVDDYKTDPAGHAGDRIACGVVTTLFARPTTGIR